MKCPECDGTGKVQKWFYERTGFGKCEKVCGDVKCEWCNGTGELEQTNEEWFCSLPTEEKAEVLTHLEKVKVFLPAINMEYVSDDEFWNGYVNLSEKDKCHVLNSLKHTRIDLE